MVLFALIACAISLWLLNRVRESLGTPVCLVNNASVFEHDSVTGFSADALDFHMRTNLTAPVLLSRALYAMTPEGSQSVAINLLDQKLDNLNPSFLSYTLSKAALNTATTAGAGTGSETARCRHCARHYTCFRRTDGTGL